jgi:isopentenyl phosphate kinase
MDLGETVFVKLGGSLITDKGRPYTARHDVIERLCREIHEAREARRRARPLALLVGHGGGSFPHTSATRYATARGIVDERSWEGFVRVHEDAVRLNGLVRAGLERAGELAMTIQPSAAAVTRAGRIVSWAVRPVELLLGAGVIPVPYGDVCVDEGQGCSIVSTEEILRHLAGVLRPARVLLVGKVDGVLDAEGRVIPRLDRAGLQRLGGALASDGAADVTGGMRHKLERAFEMGAPTEIINGLVPDVLRRALLGERGLGTIIDA